MSRTVRLILLCFTLPWIWQNAAMRPRELSKRNLRNTRTNWRQYRKGKKVTGVSEWKSPLVWTICGLVSRAKKSQRPSTAPALPQFLQQAIQDHFKREIDEAQYHKSFQVGKGQPQHGRHEGLWRIGSFTGSGGVGSKRSQRSFQHHPLSRLLYEAIRKEINCSLYILGKLAGEEASLQVYPDRGPIQWPPLNYESCWWPLPSF